MKRANAKVRRTDGIRGGVGSLRIYLMLVTPLSSHVYRIDAMNTLHTQLGTLRVNVWVLVYCLDMAFADGTQA